jgi:hypothetical protein
MVDVIAGWPDDRQGAVWPATIGTAAKAVWVGVNSESGVHMSVTRRTGVALAISLGLLATAVGGTMSSAGAATADAGPATVPGAPYTRGAGAANTLTFAGYQWTVKSSTSPIGPGPNLFDATGPYVDPAGGLHLRIVKTKWGWESSEVILGPTLGYGTYRWTVHGPVSTLDPNVVLALFTYDDSDTSPSNREIDFEASRFGDASATTNAQFVVQPSGTPGNLQRISLAKSALTTVTLTWVPGSVTFSAATGRGRKVKTVPTWTNSSSSVPTNATEQVHMSLWLFRGAPPMNGRGASITVTGFQFSPAS